MVQCFRRILPIIRSQDSDGTSRALFFQLLSDVMESPSGPRAFEQLLAALKLRLDTVWSGMDKLRSSGLRIACSESDLRALDLNQHSLCLGLLVNDGFIAEQVAKVDQRVDDLVASCHHIASAMTALQTMSNEPDAESSEPTINICALGDSGKVECPVFRDCRYFFNRCCFCVCRESRLCYSPSLVVRSLK